MDEPSVLDYIKSLLNPRRGKITIPPPDQPVARDLKETPAPVSTPLIVMEKPASPGYAWPWRMLSSLLLALVAQRLLEPPNPSMYAGLVFYLVAAALLIWGAFRHEWRLPELPTDAPHAMNTRIRIIPFILSLPFLVGAFLAFKGNIFSFVNLFLWFIALGLVLWSFWMPAPAEGRRSTGQVLKSLFGKPTWSVHFSPGLILALVAIGLVVFFRFHQLNQVPGEMFSDHAEKLLDVSDVLNGQYSIFFPRNTGREAIQFYLTAAIIKIFNTGLTFISLKLGTTLLGVMALPFIYLLAREIGGRRLALMALFLAGIAYWPNVISRVGLRFPLYAAFTAPMLYFLVRGLRTSNRNDFLLAGLFLGLGLHGYSPFRIVPLVVVILVGLYLLHPQAKGKRGQVIVGLIMLAFVSFVVFLPLLRYMTEDPQMFVYRAFTRLGDTERPLPGPALVIFLSNAWKAIIMPFWKDGEIWVHSVTGRPALDVVSAALLFLGIGLLVARYIRKRHWMDLFLLVSIPLLMLPSILSLAFPDENPSLNRTGAAIIPVFITAAIALESIFTGLMQRARSVWGKSLAWLVVLCLAVWSMAQNYDLVFNQYKNNFLAGAWNTSQIGGVIRSFADSVGSPDTAYVVPFPYWVDTRLVGINAGFPEKDYALWPEGFTATLYQPGVKLFILKVEDVANLELLYKLYPHAVLYFYDVPREGKDFYGFFVPGD